MVDEFCEVCEAGDLLEAGLCAECYQEVGKIVTSIDMQAKDVHDSAAWIALPVMGSNRLRERVAHDLREMGYATNADRFFVQVRVRK